MEPALARTGGGVTVFREATMQCLADCPLSPGPLPAQVPSHECSHGLSQTTHRLLQPSGNCEELGLRSGLAEEHHAYPYEHTVAHQTPRREPLDHQLVRPCGGAERVTPP